MLEREGGLCAWAWEGWSGEVRGEECLGEEESERMYGGGGLLAWVETSTARMQGGH